MLPVRGATIAKSPELGLTDISIHAPRAGSDDLRPDARARVGISIHAPRAGSDPFEPGLSLKQFEFQSMLPVRGATHIGGHATGD